MILQPNNEIWYTTTDGDIVTLDSSKPFLDADGNNIPIVSNTYENGKGIIKLEKECYSFETSTFSNQHNLLTIILPDSVTTIGNMVFNNCDKLTEITIPNSVTTIKSMAFFGCTSLTGITLGNRFTSIESYAFSDCTKLSVITLLRATPPTLGADVFDSIASNAVIYVPSNSVDAYKSATNWSNYADKIQAIQ